MTQQAPSKAPLSAHTVERLAAAAAAAPSMHNTQPWRFVVRATERVVEVYADPDRSLRHSDPHGRAVHLAAGAALLNLRLAVACSGAEPVVRLLPDPHNPLLLGCVRLGGAYRPRRGEQDLCAAIQQRHTNRQPFTDRAVPRQVVAELAEAAALEGAELLVPGPEAASRVTRLSADADAQLRSDPAYLAELEKWTRSARQRPGEGIPDQALGPKPKTGHAPVRNLWPSQDRVVPREVFEAAPQLVVISTRVDERASWLRAGQAMHRVLLLATHHGLQASPLTPLLEVAGHPGWEDPAFGGGHPAMILRLGYATPGPTYRAAPVAAGTAYREPLRRVPHVTGCRKT
ncbi:MAG TPA: nitroreductase family protein [Streptosporangiaceae bacterium]|nr:nitroreductase family protein [Streptosporangiaceae bacterium]